MVQIRLRDLIFLLVITALVLGWWTAVRRADVDADDVIPVEFGRSEVAGWFEATATSRIHKRIIYDRVEARGSMLICWDGDRYKIHVPAGDVTITPVDPAPPTPPVEDVADLAAAP